MKRRGQAKRRTTAVRLTTILTLAAIALSVLAPNIASADSVYTTISPRTNVADDIQSLYKLIFWLSLIVFIGVQFGVVWTAVRYRRRSDDEPRPPQIHGNKMIEITWTIIPAVILLVIFIPTVKTLFDHESEAKAGEKNGYVVDVVGKQWWWELTYTKPDTVANVITANELYLPVDKPVTINLESNNVIHSFFVPQLTGKLDVIPGHVNKLGFTTPSTPGVYYGECAEYCGDSHAFMRFKVMVVSQANFDAYIAGWKAGPSSQAAAVSGDVTKLPTAMGICLACHRVEGTTASVAPVGLTEDAGTLSQPGAARTAGPNLTDFACRTTIGAGIMPNTADNLKAWLKDPGSIKQGNYMATVIKAGTLKDDQINQIVAYLEGLHPEGGCVPLTGENADKIVQLAPAASPAAVASPSPTAAG
jgi:cytochrome c oxidase subunit 2